MKRIFLYATILLAAAVCIASVSVAGTPGELRKLMSADEARAWQGVGRLELEGAGFCTGALIAPQLVLTAAHCTFDPATGAPLEPGRIEFRAGWREGRAAAYEKARRVVVHPGYVHTGKASVDAVGTDIALIELEHPIRNAAVRPFGRAERPGIGATVKVVSYARDRSEIPSLEEPCEILGSSLSVLVLSCKANFGASGSPIFVMENGEPRIASVVSAKATWRQRDVALGASLGQPLEELMAHLQRSNGVFRARRPGAKSLAEQLGRDREAGLGAITRRP